MKLGQAAANKKAKRWQEKAEKTVPVIRAEEKAKFAVKKARLEDKIEELAKKQAAELLAKKDIQFGKQAVYLSVARKDRRDLSGKLTTAMARGGFGPPKLSILLLAKCSRERVSSCALPA
jgi:hypothetical protein